jgi:hypothetical protein
MKLYTKHVAAVVAVGLCLVAPSSGADPNSNSFDKVAPHGELSRLSAEWWQWALSIPTPANPLADRTGADCMSGQRGPVWFLAGALFGGKAERTCTLPADKELFFPIINVASINTPNVCFQGPEDDSVEALRLAAATFIDNASDVAATLDRKPIHHLRRIESDVFDVTLPADNILNPTCVPSVPAGVYSPGVDDGIYAFLKPLDVGRHELHFHATNGDFFLDITYHLIVVPVRRK